MRGIMCAACAGEVWSNNVAHEHEMEIQSLYYA